MLTGETSIGYEINISENAALNISGALTKIKFDYFNEFGSQIYSQRNYLELALEIIKYFKAPRPANAMFLGLGLIGDACISEKLETRNAGLIEIRKARFLGYHLGVSAFCGFQTELTSISTIAFSLGTKMDLRTFYSNNLNEIKFLKSLISLTYSIRLSNYSYGNKVIPNFYYFKPIHFRLYPSSQKRTIIKLKY